MRRILLLIVLVSEFICANAQIFDPDRPMILPFVVCADSINAQMHDNLNKPPHTIVTETNGWVQIPNTYYKHNGKSMGIILVRTSYYAYVAYDARCPHCFYDDEIANSKIKMYSRLSAICDVCGAEAQSLVTGSPGMTRYDHGPYSPAMLNVYLVEEIKKGKKTYLRIHNAENGANNEWKPRLLEKAALICVTKHAGQRDKMGQAYFQHPMRVAMRCQTDEQKMVALLHDTIEDTDVTAEYLLAEGFPQSVVDGILSVTKREGENYEDSVVSSLRNRKSTVCFMEHCRARDLSLSTIIIGA